MKATCVPQAATVTPFGLRPDMAAALIVKSPGARTLVQDTGFRNGRSQGVPACGVLDRAALRLVNALLGNAPGTEALEVALSSPVLVATEGPVRVAISGTLRGTVQRPDGSSRPVGGWTATTLAPGDALHLQPPERFAVGLIGIRGGVDLPLCLDSRSTCLAAGFGGVMGRSLQAGDLLRLRQPTGPVPDHDMCVTKDIETATGPIRVVAGPQHEWLDADGAAAFFGSTYTVTPQLDRMGMRLDGHKLSFLPGKTADIISDGAAPGAIQVPGSGQPIILLADAQTTGGYPKVATVIRSDLPRLSACVPGDRLTFRSVSIAEAEGIAAAHEARIKAAIDSIGPAFDPGMIEGRLRSVSLIGGAVDMARPDHFPGHLYSGKEESNPCD